MSDTSIPEDDMATDGVDAPITEDTETSEPAKDQHRYAFCRGTSRCSGLSDSAESSPSFSQLHCTYFWAAATTLLATQRIAPRIVSRILLILSPGLGADRLTLGGA